MSKKKLTPELLAAIKEDRERGGATLSDVVRKYGVSKSTAYTAIKDLDASNVKRASPSRRVVPHKISFDWPPRPPLSKSDLGEAARQIIAARLMLAGHIVFMPLSEDTPVDLLVLREDGKALKCQCKCAFVDKAGAHLMPLQAVRKWGPNSKAVRHRYSSEEVDFFLGYVHETDSVLVIPFNEVSHLRGFLRIWILRSPTGKSGTPSFDVAPFCGAFHLLSS